MGTVTPPSFLGQDLLPWLVSQGLCDDADAATSSVGLVCGSVRVGRLCRGRQAPVARVLQDGFTSVRVDRGGSHVGNPFCSASTARLCRAYDELLRTLLTVPIDIDECLQDFKGMRQDSFPTSALLSPFEKDLLHHISEKHHVCVHRLRVRPLDVRAWLVQHARLLLLGERLQLNCWCTCGTISEMAPWACHAQLLAGALLWLALTRRADFMASGPHLPPAFLPTQVRALGHGSCTGALTYHVSTHFLLPRLHLGLSRGDVLAPSAPSGLCSLPLTIHEQVTACWRCPHLLPSARAGSRAYLPDP